MRFTIKHSNIVGDSFGEYQYDIYDGNVLIAKYWHDYRGDAHGIKFETGFTEENPIGIMTDFVCGGGPNPLALSVAAEAYIQTVINKND